MKCSTFHLQGSRKYKVDLIPQGPCLSLYYVYVQICLYVDICVYFLFFFQYSNSSLTIPFHYKPLFAVRVAHRAELSLKLSEFCMGNAYPRVSAVRDCGYLSGEGSWRSPLANGRELWKLRRGS